MSVGPMLRLLSSMNGIFAVKILLTECVEHLEVTAENIKKDKSLQAGLPTGTARQLNGTMTQVQAFVDFGYFRNLGWEYLSRSVSPASTEFQQQLEEVPLMSLAMVMAVTESWIVMMRSFLIALSFSHHVLGLTGVQEAIESGFRIL
ncbi:hypothetical protein AK812_SmicGene9294 [Symbiodinium microadriaticum]|uniref:Uncharacterized protein n=1 Tax=Symbiodinium microadriaticum TaxID=2951 RepID=A0A1Q9EIY2_SYMMI|nr:hypothetical protein AK812_SmicGene9294 [Symbiodinium microadriaticum]